MEEAHGGRGVVPFTPIDWWKSTHGGRGVVLFTSIDWWRSTHGRRVGGGQSLSSVSDLHVHSHGGGGVLNNVVTDFGTWRGGGSPFFTFHL